MKTPLENQELSPRQKQRLCEQFNRTFLDRVVWLTLEEGREVLTRAKFKARVCDGVPCAEFEDYGIQPIDGGRIRGANVSVFSYLNDLRQELYEVRAIANAHAAQPGAPREDGVWVVRTKSGEYICERKTLEGRTHYTVTSPSMLHVLYDSSIQMHRKHEPLEVPHG